MFSSIVRVDRSLQLRRISLSSTITQLAHSAPTLTTTSWSNSFRPIRASRTFSSGASYDPSSYSSMPSEPQYSLPTDAPKGTFELFYFALRGRAEQIRLLLVEAGLPYKDRLLTQWQLRKLKAAGSPVSNENFLAAQRDSPLPFGGLPLLKHNDLCLGQTSAILQYIAEEGKLWPDTSVDRARGQMIIAGCEDLFQHYWPIKLDQNRYLYHSGSFPLTPGTNEGYIAAPSTHLKGPYAEYSVPRSFRRETLPRWLTYFEAILSNNKDGNQYFVGGKLSYVDIVVFAHLQAVLSIEKECLKPFPLLEDHFNRIGRRPNIQSYLDKRPESGL